jgi:RimJ/RimL family protein N-acetyltransferase
MRPKLRFMVRELWWSKIGLSRLISLIRPSNLPSLRAAEKIGMTKEREILRDGEVYWIYAVMKGEV